MKQHSQTHAINAYVEIDSTRRELLKYLATERAEERAAAQVNHSRGSPKAAGGAKVGFNWTSLLGAGVSSWWHDHPARSVAMVLESATSEYARRKPIQVVAVAAVAGAAVVLLRPWRMVSVTALMLTLLRSSNFTSVATSVLDSAAQSMKKEKL